MAQCCQKVLSFGPEIYFGLIHGMQAAVGVCCNPEVVRIAKSVDWVMSVESAQGSLLMIGIDFSRD